MLPNLTRDNLPKSTYVHMKDLCKINVPHPAVGKTANFNHLLRRQLGPFHCLSTCVTTFVYLVVHVFHLCSYKEVIRTNTSGSVTSMTNKQTLRDRAIGQFIGNPMHATRDTIPFERPMLFPARACFPYPAGNRIINDRNIRPEHVRRQSNTQTRPITRKTTKTIGFIGRCRTKGLPTGFARLHGRIEVHQNVLSGVMPSDVRALRGRLLAFSIPHQGAKY